MTKNETLKWCPFCGSKAIGKDWPWGLRWEIEHKADCYIGSSCNGQKVTFINDADIEEKKAWNRRVK